MIAGVVMVAVLQAAASASPGPAEREPVPPLIAVILPSAADAPMLEALNRLRGEADSVGLELRLVEADGAGAPRTQLATVAQHLGPAAVVALMATEASASPDGAAATGARAMDVWFLDPGTGETSLGHLTVEEAAGTRADLVLAVRVVDFIRARMFDSLVRNLAATRTRRSPAAAHTVEGRRYVAAGVGAVGSFAGVDAAWLPALAIGYACNSWLRLTLLGAGFGTRPRRENAAGSAVMDQKLIRLQATFLGPTWWRLRPFAAAGGEAYFVSVHGVGWSGNVGYDPSSWSPGGHAAAGLGITLARHVELQLAGGMTVLARAPKVYVADAEVARTGWPAWSAQALVGAAF